MKRIYTKIVRNAYVVVGMVPISKEDVDRLNTFKDHQALKNRVSGVQKERSIKQHRWAMWMIRCVSKNDDDPDWNTFDKAKRRIKLAMEFFEEGIIVERGRVYFELKSFSFDEMNQQEANKTYNEIKSFCALRLGCSEEDLEANAKRKTGY